MKSTVRNVLGLLAYAALASAQTHTVVTTDQSFTTTTGHSLTGTYQCSGAGTIDDCAITDGSITGATITNPTIVNGTMSGTTGSFAGNSATSSAFVNTPTICGAATAPRGVDASGNAVGCHTPVPTATAIAPVSTATPAPTATLVPTATPIPTATPVLSTSFKMTFSGNTGATTLDNAAVNYITAMGRGVSATQSDVWQLTAYAGVYRKLFCQTQGTPGGAASYAFLVCPNGACPAGPPTCTITSAIQSCSDTVTTYNGSINDTVSIKVTPAGAPTARTAQCTFEYDAS